MKYLILTIASVDYAKAISGFLWSIQKNKDHSTEYYNNWIVHPNKNEVALAFPDMEIFIDDNADATQLVNQVRQAITEEEAQQMEDKINQGGIVKPVDFIPQSLGSNILTRSEAEASGWFEIED
jgi:hypothetical protein